MAACLAMKTSRARTFSSERAAQAGVSEWTSAAPIEIAQVNTYSWHPNTRGPQLYKLYAADGSDPKFNLDPKRGVDPASCGWKFIALVSTLSNQGEEGGQYAANVGDESGSLGKYRYLLFDCYITELHDNWGNTFYSEVDVIRKK